MNITINEPIVIGYTCCGPTYRKSLYEKIKNYYFDNDNIYYCIVTDNKKYFSKLKRKNLIVNELKDFYDEFPKLEKNEYFLESKNKNDYAKKFMEQNYRFPMSTYRFNVLQAIKLGVKNVSMLCTDSVIDFNVFNNDIYENKNTMFNAVSWWQDEVKDESSVSYCDMKIISDYLYENYSYKHSETIQILDEAARLFIPRNLEELNYFFKIWNEVVEFLYEKNHIPKYKASYAIHDEYVLAVIYDFLKINFPNVFMDKIFNVNHNEKIERFWLPL